MTRAPTPRPPRAATKLRAVPATPAPEAPEAPQTPETPTTPGASGKAARHDSWSLATQAAFLRALSATHSVSEAARSVGKSRQAAYRLRSRLKGKPFDLAWEVAFHHSYDVLAHTALERALNGVEVPVYYQGEKIDSYRRYDERLTVALLGRFTPAGNPRFGRLGPAAERHARDFEGLLAQVEQGAAVETGAGTPSDPGEIERMRQFSPKRGFRAQPNCPSGWSDDELVKVLQDIGWKE